MSSTIFMKSCKPIPLEDWKKFCKENVIVYSPQTGGQNVFYCDDVEIFFGIPNWEEIPRLLNGNIEFSKATPLKEANKITVGSYYGRNLKLTVITVRSILKNWPKIISVVGYAPEFRCILNNKEILEWKTGEDEE